MKILFLSAKPSVTFNGVDPILAADKFKHADILIGHCTTVLGRVQFDYPRGLKYRDYPYTGEVRYRQRTADTLSASFHHTLYLPERRGGSWNHVIRAVAPSIPSRRLLRNSYKHAYGPSFSEPLHILEPGNTEGAMAMAVSIMRHADKIVLLPEGFERNQTRQFHFANILSGLRPDDTTASYHAYVPLSWAPVDLARTFAAPPIRVAADEAGMRAGMVRERFDWLYNTNALAIFSEVLRRHGTSGEHSFLSKYALLTLWLLRDGQVQSEGEIIHMMSRYTGSGRYDLAGRRSPGVGSPTSRAAIVEQLKAAGLLETRDTGGLSRSGDPILALSISERGTAVLDDLHPRTFDPDLPFRLAEWADMGLERANPAMERYINTLFSRQIRFQAKGRREDARAF